MLLKEIENEILAVTFSKEFKLETFDSENDTSVITFNMNRFDNYTQIFHIIKVKIYFTSYGTTKQNINFEKILENMIDVKLEYQ